MKKNYANLIGWKWVHFSCNPSANYKWCVHQKICSSWFYVMQIQLSFENLVMLIYTKLHSKSWCYLYKLRCCCIIQLCIALWAWWLNLVNAQNSCCHLVFICDTHLVSGVCRLLRNSRSSTHCTQHIWYHLYCKWQPESLTVLDCTFCDVKLRFFFR